MRWNTDQNWKKIKNKTKHNKHTIIVFCKKKKKILERESHAPPPRQPRSETKQNLCQMDEATLAALPFCLYMDSHCKSIHGRTRTSRHFKKKKRPTQGSKRSGQRRPAGIETRRGGVGNTEEKKRRVSRMWGLRGGEMWSGEAGG